jgi:hypothetical protein
MGMEGTDDGKRESGVVDGRWRRATSVQLVEGGVEVVEGVKKKGKR